MATELFSDHNAFIEGFAVIMVILQDAYDREMTDSRKMSFYQAAIRRNCTLASLEWAVNEWVAFNRRLPVPAELMDLAKTAPRSTRTVKPAVEPVMLPEIPQEEAARRMNVLLRELNELYGTSLERNTDGTIASMKKRKVVPFSRGGA